MTVTTEVKSLKNGILERRQEQLLALFDSRCGLELDLEYIQRDLRTIQFGEEQEENPAKMPRAIRYPVLTF